MTVMTFSRGARVVLPRGKKIDKKGINGRFEKKMEEEDEEMEKRDKLTYSLMEKRMRRREREGWDVNGCNKIYLSPPNSNFAFIELSIGAPILVSVHSLLLCPRGTSVEPKPCFNQLFYCVLDVGRDIGSYILEGSKI